MSNLITGIQHDNGNLITPKARMLYPNLFKAVLPRGETDQDKARFQISLLFPTTADLTLLKAAVQTVLEEHVTAKARQTTKIKLPFLKTEDQPRLADYAEEYPVLIRANARIKPDVINPAGNRELKEDEDADEVYGGRWCRVSIRPFWFDHPTGGKGVSFGLQNVQVLDHDEPMAGGRVRGLGEFEPVATADGGDPLADLM